MVRNTALIVGAAIIVSGCSESETVKECREHLEQKLTSPSSLSIVDTTTLSERLPVKDARTAYILPEILSGFNSQETVAIHIVSFTYDADNSYGAAIRGHETCTMIESMSGPIMVPDNVKKDPSLRLQSPLDAASEMVR
jgi:hypothetical protein